MNSFAETLDGFAIRIADTVSVSSVMEMVKETTQTRIKALQSELEGKRQHDLEANNLCRIISDHFPSSSSSSAEYKKFVKAEYDRLFHGITNQEENTEEDANYSTKK